VVTATAVRWGILGTAHINRRVIPAMRTVDRSVVVAVASRNAARAESYAAEWAIPKAVAGYRALLGRDDLTAVYIPLPNSLHVEWTLEAVAAGKHVLCEKPLALDPQEVDRIDRARAVSNVVVAEGFMYRHEPLTARVVQLVRDGAVGALRAIVGGFTYARSRTNDVRLDAALGGGALFDVGCYPVSYACLLAPERVETVRGLARWTPAGVDEEFAGLVRFRSGIDASVYAGFRAAYRTWLDVVGSEGSLRVPNPFKPGLCEQLELERLGDLRRFEVAGSPLLFVRQIENFVSAVLDGVAPAISLEDSRRIAGALSLLHASASPPGALATRKDD
jgi:predicted dehydrogenase